MNEIQPEQSQSFIEDQFGTRAVHAGLVQDKQTGALTAPIFLTTTFAQSDAGQPLGGYAYTRSGNPNRSSFEKAVATLENAKYALAFSSGLAATAAVLQGLASNSHVISIADVYGGTHRYFMKVAGTHNLTVTFTKSIEGDVRNLIRDDTSLIWIETPSNPTLSLVDIGAVAEAAREKGVLVVVDNTFLSPYIQNPLDLGADIVLHSVTKFINGHSDVLMGVIATNDLAVQEKLRFLQNAAGSVPSPFDCWLAHRGLRTIHLRVQAASENALAIASALESSSGVLEVLYPGLDTHPQRGTAVRQHRGGLGGGIVSFRIKGGAQAAVKFCKATRLFALAESLGGVESLCEIPAVMTHAGMPQDVREECGVYDDLIRLSVGVEGQRDLVMDILQAVDIATA